jgi:Lipocalin-like domain
VRDEHDSQPLAVALVGTWQLVSRTDVNQMGEQIVDPSLGSDPVALLIYDRAGHFAAQFMKRDRTTAIPSPTVAAAPNNTRARDGYDAYFGTYAVDEGARTVTQRLMGALEPANVGMVVTRAMQVDGETLTIALDTRSAKGDPVTRTLIWTRVG